MPAVAEQLSSQVAGRYPFEVVERVEKAEGLITAIIVIAGFVAKKTFGAFFNEAGKDMYAFVKNLRRRDSPSAPAEVQFHLHLHEASKMPVVVLNIDQTVAPKDLNNIDEASIRRAIASAGGEQNLQRLVGIVKLGGEVEVPYLVDAQGF